MHKKSYISFSPYYPSAKSVIGPFVHDQVQAIRRSDVFARIVVLKPQPWYVRCLDYEYNGVTVHGVRTFQMPSKVFPNFFDVLNRFFFFRRLRQLGLADAEVLHLHTSPLAKYGVWVKKVFPLCRVWLQHHDLDPLLVRMGTLRNIGWHQRMVIRRRVADVSCADLQICVSELGLRQLCAFPKSEHPYADYVQALNIFSDMPSVNVKNSTVLYNGVDAHLFYPAQKKERNGVFKIGCVAGFYDWKGQYTLIQSFEQMIHRNKTAQQMCRLVLVGVGEKRDECEAYVRQHNLSEWISFEETRSHDALLGFYQSLDLFVLPSFFETFACVYFEAYNCGVPFICCKGQGNEESILSEVRERWTVLPQNVDDLAVKMENVFENRLSVANEPLTVDYRIDSLVTQFLDKVLDKGSGV